MRNVRLIFRKTGRAKFISHLDLNRVMLRVLKRSRLPVWFTQGYNPHAFITFALPLSLGFESRYDVMDFRVNDDGLTDDQILSALKFALPPDIIAEKVYEPKTKPKIIAFAEFELDISCSKDNFARLSDFLEADEIAVEKTTKKKEVKTFNVKPKIKEYKISETDSGALLWLLLPAGNEENINPMIILDAAEKTGLIFEVESVIRGKIFDNELNLFE